MIDDIGKRIHDRRIELGLTLEEVGQACGVGRSTVRKWETGMIKNMKRDKIALLANVLQISPVELVPFGDFRLHGEVIADELVRKLRKIDELTAESEGMINKEDWARLEALHQNPELGLLFDRTRKMSKEDIDFMLQFADRILKERDVE